MYICMHIQIHKLKYVGGETEKVREKLQRKLAPCYLGQS